jgi:hypothetical protein
MRFRRGDDYHAISDCRRYTVARIVLGDRERLEAFRGRELIAHSDNPKAEAWAHCVAACEADAKERA